jgi:hypothetical protein
MGQGEKRDGKRCQDHDPARRRRTGLHEVVLWALLADVLTIGSVPQVADEPRRNEDRDQERENARDENP